MLLRAAPDLFGPGSLPREAATGNGRSANGFPQLQSPLAGKVPFHSRRQKKHEAAAAPWARGSALGVPMALEAQEL